MWYRDRRFSDSIYLSMYACACVFMCVCACSLCVCVWRTRCSGRHGCCYAYAWESAVQCEAYAHLDFVLSVSTKDDLYDSLIAFFSSQLKCHISGKL